MFKKSHIILFCDFFQEKPIHGKPSSSVSTAATQDSETENECRSETHEDARESQEKETFETVSYKGVC